MVKNWGAKCLKTAPNADNFDPVNCLTRSWIMDKEASVFPNWLKQRCLLTEDNKTGEPSHMGTRSSFNREPCKTKLCDVNSSSPENIHVLEEANWSTDIFNRHAQL